MAFVRVQEQGASASTLGTNVARTLTFGANFTSGNVVVVGIECNDSGAAGPVATGTGITFTRYTWFIGDGSHDNAALWVGVVGGGASNTVVITPSSGRDLANHAVIGAEFSGTSTVVDGTPPTPTNVASATPSVTSATPSQTGDLAVAFCGNTATVAPTGTPAGWTTLTRQSTTCAIDGAWFDLAGSSAAVTPQWTFAVSRNALLNVVLIKQAAAGAFVAAPLRDVLQAVNRAATW